MSGDDAAKALRDAAAKYEELRRAWRERHTLPPTAPSPSAWNKLVAKRQPPTVTAFLSWLKDR